MSYLVLARKWRPQTFAEVVAQPHVVQALQNAIRLERLPHALLLTGSRGIGKTTIARLLAKTINCEAEGRDSIEPCNECSMCKEITSGRSVDVMEIDGASNRSIDDIRELRENVQYRPSRGKHKVYIIDEVHMLTREAFNALLKTLEEPPDHVLFFFATTEPHKIPITILSRCQRFDFKRANLNNLKGHLKRIAKAEGLELSDKAILMIARAANGGMRDSMSLLDQVTAFAGKQPTDAEVALAIGAIKRELLHEIGESLVTNDPTRCLQCIEEIFSSAYDMRQLTQELAAFLRDLMVVKICKDPSDITNLSDDELEELKQLATKADPTLLQQMFQLLTRSAEDIARSNQPRLLLEMTLIQMCRLEPVRPFNQILKQLSDLENRLHELPSTLGTSTPSGQASPAVPSTPTPQNPSAPPSLSSAPQRQMQQVKQTPRQTNTPSPTESPTEALASEPPVSQPARVDEAKRPKSSKEKELVSSEAETKPKPNEASTQSLQTVPKPAPEKTVPASILLEPQTAILKEQKPQHREERTQGKPERQVEKQQVNEIAEPLPQALPSKKSFDAEFEELHSEPESAFFIKWEQDLKELKSQKGFLFLVDALEHAHCRLSEDEKTLYLFYTEKQEFHQRQLKEPDKIKSLEAFLRKKGYNYNLSLQWQKQKAELPGTDLTTESIHEARARRHKEFMRRLRKESFEHPVMQRIMKSFPNSEIVSVKPQKASK